MQINPYLNFNGTREEAFLFYEKLLGGKLESINRFGDKLGRRGWLIAGRIGGPAG